MMIPPLVYPHPDQARRGERARRSRIGPHPHPLPPPEEKRTRFSSRSLALTPAHVFGTDLKHLELFINIFADDSGRLG